MTSLRKGARKVLALLVLANLVFPCISQDVTGISFIKNEWDTALAKAKADEKIIFIDAYTTWCGPCKMMDQEVFSDSMVGAFYNANFINLKLDMEKGDGLEVAKKYDVRAYPSFLFLDPELNLVHRGIGYQPIERFINLGREASDPSRQIGTLARMYQRGDRSEALLYDYAMALLRAGDNKGREIGQLYLNQQDNWATRKNMDLVRNLVRKYDDPFYKFIVAKKHLFFKEFGEQNINPLLLGLLQRDLFSRVDQLKLKDVKSIFENTFTASKAAPYYDLFEVNYYDIKGDKAAYVSTAKAYVKKYPTLTWSTLNQIAWNFYEKIDDPKALKWAKKWAKKSIAKDSNHFNNDTLAALYYKLGKQKPALKYAHRAIDLAMQAGAPFDETSALLEKIEAL